MKLLKNNCLCEEGKICSHDEEEMVSVFFKEAGMSAEDMLRALAEFNYTKRYKGYL